MRAYSLTRTGSTRSLALFAAALTVGFGLAGCASVDDMLFGSAPPMESEAPSPSSGTPGTLPSSGGPTETATLGPSDMGTAGIKPVTIEPGSNTGTAVSRTIAGLRSEIASMQGNIVSAANRLGALKGAGAQYASSYHEAKARITTRLQVGTTRGNPELVSQWNSAQSALDALTGNINSLNALGTKIADYASRTHYVLTTIQSTYNVSGAVDEDHRQLSVLEDETNQTIVLIDHLLKAVSDDIQRQTAYVANERASLTTLAAAIKNGELYGSELGSTMVAPASYGPGITGAPLVTIRFDHPNVEYQQILYTALSQALQSRPGASFQVVAVSPTRGTVAAVQLAQTRAQRHAQAVMRSMTDMGVPGTRLSVTSTTDPSITASEVRVYVR